MEVILALEDTLRGTLATRGHTIFDIRNVVVRIIEEALRFAVDALRQQDFKMCHTLLERAERYTEPSVVSAELQGCFTGAETQRLGLRQKTFRMLCVFEKERCGGHVSKAGIVNRRGSSSGVSRPTKPKVERVVLGQQQQQQQPFAPPRAAPTRREEESGGDMYYDDTTDEDNDDDDDESALPKEQDRDDALSPTSRVPDFTARTPFLRRVEEELRQVREAYLRRTGAMADAADMMAMPSSATSPLRPQPPPRRNWRQRQDEIDASVQDVHRAHANARALEEARAVEREVRRHVRRARWLVKDTQRRTNTAGRRGSNNVGNNDEEDDDSDDATAAVHSSPSSNVGSPSPVMCASWSSYQLFSPSSVRTSFFH
eukprot:PhM_4_TR11671/c0_g1_i1/m.13352